MKLLPLPWRARVLGVTVPALAAALALSSLISPGPDQSADVPLASETQCLPIAPIRSVDGLNRLVTKVRGPGEFQGADVGADVELQDGRRLWVFGDTLRAKSFVGQRFVRNSMLVFDPTCAQVVLPSDHGALIPDRADGVGYWPMSIAKISRTGYDLVGVAAQRVRSADTSGTTTSFDNLGPAIALFIVETGQAPQLLSVKDIGADDASTQRPTWGAASEVRDGWVYLYGTSNPGTDLVFGFDLRVARVRAADIQDVTAWRYWDGKKWGRDASRSKVLIPAQGGVSQTLSVFERDGRWYAVSKRDEFVGTDLVIWSSPSPTGPFVAGKPVAQIPSTDGGLLRYMPLAHPDLLPEDGSIVVSYSQNETDVTQVAKNPFLYRPRFLRVPLP